MADYVICWQVMAHWQLMLEDTLSWKAYTMILLYVIGLFFVDCLILCVVFLTKKNLGNFLLP